MTDGLHAESRMLGDVKFHQHGGVDAAAAERWRERDPGGLAGRADAGGRGRASATRSRRSPSWRLDRAGAWTAGEPLPLSFAQERLWFLDQLEPGSPLYNIPVALRLAAGSTWPRSARTLREIVRRHEVAAHHASRARDGQPVAGGRRRPPASRCRSSTSPALPPAAREAELRRLRAAEARRPFDLARGPLLRALLLRLGAEEHALLLLHAPHRRRRLVDGRAGARAGGPLRPSPAGGPSPLPELPLQYADFAVWQRGWLAGRGAGARSSPTGAERLAGVAGLLELPTDRPRPAVQTSRGATRPVDARAAGARRHLAALWAGAQGRPCS